MYEVSVKDKFEKHENFDELFRGFVLSCFRDKEISSFPVSPVWEEGRLIE
jgi:hypothetical protein